MLTNNTLSRAELNDENGTALNVHYGDILVKFGEMIDLAADHLPYITDPAKVIKSAALQNGDVIIADTAEDSTVGKCSEITGIIDKIVVSGLHTIPCRPRQKFAPGYLGYFMNSPAYHDQLLPLMQGTKVTSVSKSALEDTLLCYPTDSDEQALIGRYFMNLDNLITLHQRQGKPSLIDPFLMFQEYTSAWEQRKLDDILVQRVEHQTISPDAPLLAFSYAEGVINPEDKKSNKRDFIMTDKFNKVFSRTELNDIIYNPANVIHGAIHRNKLGTGVVSPIYKIFVCNNVSAKYMGERLHTDRFIQEITKYIEGTVVKLRTLSPEMFLDMTIEVPPSYEEQERIGEFFEALDNLITLHQREYFKQQTEAKNVKYNQRDGPFL